MSLFNVAIRLLVDGVCIAGMWHTRGDVPSLGFAVWLIALGVWQLVFEATDRAKP